MKFTSIKQIPKEAIEMIDDVQWFYWQRFPLESDEILTVCCERLDSGSVLEICNKIQSDGNFMNNQYYYIEPRELEDKTYGINLYKKIHGEGR